MIRRVLKNGMSIAALAAAAYLSAASEAKAETKVPVKLAVKTTLGEADAPVRTAEYSDADRSQVKFQTAGWRGRGYYRAYYGYPAYYPTYGYYPAPTYTYYYPAAPVYAPRRAYYAPAPVYVPYGTYYYYGW